MTDIQLGDIAAGGVEEAGEAAAGEAAETVAEESTGEWLKDMTELLDEKGLLEPLLFGKDANIQKQQPTPESGEGGGGVDLDADAIAEIGKSVIDTMGDVRISEVVKFAESNPEQVNQLIDQKMGENNGN